MNSIEKNRLDKILGPSGSFGGIIIMLTGLVAIYHSYTAIILVLIGAFAAFTGTVTIIDYTMRRVKYATAWFGIIYSGPWINIDSSMTVRVRQSGRTYKTYSRSNRMFSLRETDFSIVLKDSRGKELCPLRRFQNSLEAESQLMDISARLNIPVST